MAGQLESLIFIFLYAFSEINSTRLSQGVCPYPDPPKNAVLSSQSYMDEYNFNGFQAYQRVHFICRVGYRQTKGPMWSICGVTGKWHPDTKTVGVCTREMRKRPVECMGRFRCRKDLQCIDRKLRCDCKPDCRDGTDEIGCKNPKQMIIVGKKSNKKAGVITSPNYPYGYPKSEFRCTYRFYTDLANRIVIDFEEFSLPTPDNNQCRDYVQITGIHDIYKQKYNIHNDNKDFKIKRCGTDSFNTFISNSSHLEIQVRLTAGSVKNKAGGDIVNEADKGTRSEADKKRLRGYSLAWKVTGRIDSLMFLRQVKLAMGKNSKILENKSASKPVENSFLAILVPVAISALLPLSVISFVCFHLKARQSGDSRIPETKGDNGVVGGTELVGIQQSKMTGRLNTFRKKQARDNDEKRTKDDGKHTKGDGKQTKDDGKYARNNGKYAKDNGKHAKDDGKHTKDDEKHTKGNGKYAKDDGKHTKDDGKHGKDDRKHTKDDGKHMKNNDNYTKDDGKDTKDDGKHRKDSNRKNTKDDSEKYGEDGNQKYNRNFKERKNSRHTRYETFSSLKDGSNSRKSEGNFSDKHSSEFNGNSSFGRESEKTIPGRGYHIEDTANRTVIKHLNSSLEKYAANNGRDMDDNNSYVSNGRANGNSSFHKENKKKIPSRRRKCKEDDSSQSDEHHLGSCIETSNTLSERRDMDDRKFNGSCGNTRFGKENKESFPSRWRQYRKETTSQSDEKQLNISIEKSTSLLKGQDRVDKHFSYSGINPRIDQENKEKLPGRREHYASLSRKKKFSSSIDNDNRLNQGGDIEDINCSCSSGNISIDDKNEESISPGLSYCRKQYVSQNNEKNFSSSIENDYTLMLNQREDIEDINSSCSYSNISIDDKERISPGLSYCRKQYVSQNNEKNLSSSTKESDLLKIRNDVSRLKSENGFSRMRKDRALESKPENVIKRMKSKNLSRLKSREGTWSDNKKRNLPRRILSHRATGDRMAQITCDNETSRLLCEEQISSNSPKTTEDEQMVFDEIISTKRFDNKMSRMTSGSDMSSRLVRYDRKTGVAYSDDVSSCVHRVSRKIIDSDDVSNLGSDHRVSRVIIDDRSPRMNCDDEVSSRKRHDILSEMTHYERMGCKENMSKMRFDVREVCHDRRTKVTDDNRMILNNRSLRKTQDDGSECDDEVSSRKRRDILSEMTHNDRMKFDDNSLKMAIDARVTYGDRVKCDEEVSNWKGRNILSEMTHDRMTYDDNVSKMLHAERVTYDDEMSHRKHLDIFTERTNHDLMTSDDNMSRMTYNESHQTESIDTSCSRYSRTTTDDIPWILQGSDKYQSIYAWKLQARKSCRAKFKPYSKHKYISKYGYENKQSKKFRSGNQSANDSSDGLGIKSEVSPFQRTECHHNDNDAEIEYHCDVHNNDKVTEIDHYHKAYNNDDNSEIEYYPDLYDNDAEIEYYCDVHNNNDAEVDHFNDAYNNDNNAEIFYHDVYHSKPNLRPKVCHLCVKNTSNYAESSGSCDYHNHHNHLMTSSRYHVSRNIESLNSHNNHNHSIIALSNSRHHSSDSGTYTGNETTTKGDSGTYTANEAITRGPSIAKSPRLRHRLEISKEDSDFSDNCECKDCLKELRKQDYGIRSTSNVTIPTKVNNNGKLKLPRLQQDVLSHRQPLLHYEAVYDNIPENMKEMVSQRSFYNLHGIQGSDYSQYYEVCYNASSEM